MGVSTWVNGCILAEAMADVSSRSQAGPHAAHLMAGAEQEWQQWLGGWPVVRLQPVAGHFPEARQCFLAGGQPHRAAIDAFIMTPAATGRPTTIKEWK